MATLTVPTAENLLRNVRIILKQPKAENSNWSDTELIKYLNDGIKKFFLVLNQDGEGQFDKATNLDVVNNVETVALPSDFFSCKALYSIQNNYNRILRYEPNIVKSYVTTPMSGPNFYEPIYYFRGTSLVLRPIPAFTTTGGTGLYLEYTAWPTTLVVGADTLPSGISPMFNELTEMYAVYKAKISMDLTNGGNTRAAAEKHLGDLYANFLEQVTGLSKYPLCITPWNP